MSVWVWATLMRQRMDRSTVTEAAGSLDDLNKVLADRRLTVSRLRRERMGIANSTPSPEPLREAIFQARRDRDAVVSPEVEALRGRAAELTRALDRAWAGADHMRWTIYRMNEGGVTPKLSVHGRRNLAELQTALEAEAELRSQIREAAVEQGIREFPVPAPFMVSGLASGGSDGPR